MNKVFIAPIPLALLMALKAAPPQSSRWWSFALGIAMLLALLHSAEQFVYAGFGIGIILGVQFVCAAPPERIARLKQWFWIFLFVMLLCSPILVAIQHASADSGINVNRNLESVHHQPDIRAFFVPLILVLLPDISMNSHGTSTVLRDTSFLPGQHWRCYFSPLPKPGIDLFHG
jgi:hypothetical protein